MDFIESPSGKSNYGSNLVLIRLDDSQSAWKNVGRVKLIL